jgi:hypothetical protein
MPPRRPQHPLHCRLPSNLLTPLPSDLLTPLPSDLLTPLPSDLLSTQTLRPDRPCPNLNAISFPPLSRVHPDRRHLNSTGMHSLKCAAIKPRNTLK